MIKGKILISILTGAITLTSAGMTAIIANPSASSEWLNQRFSAITRQDAADHSESNQAEWFESTVPDEASLQAVAPETDLTASATSEADWDEEEAGYQAGASVDAIASASIPAGETAGSTSGGTASVDVVASASIPAGETAGSTSGGTTSVDAIASASIPAGETAGSTSGGTTSVDVVASASKASSVAPSAAKDLLTLEKAIAIARTRVGDATYLGYELDDDYPPVYELYFVSGKTEYQVEINAANGAILEIDSEIAELEDDKDDDSDRDEKRQSDDDDDDAEDDHEDDSEEDD